MVPTSPDKGAPTESVVVEPAVEGVRALELHAMASTARLMIAELRRNREEPMDRS